MHKKLRYTVLIGAFLAAGLFLLFPRTDTRIFSGTGQVFTKDKTPLGDCKMSVELTRISSPAVCYKQSFSFTLGDETFRDFVGRPYTDAADGLTLITQGYFDAEKGSINFCSLVYQEDLSYVYVSILLDEKIYFLNLGTDIPFSQLPIG